MKTMRKEQIAEKLKGLLNEDVEKFFALLSVIVKDILPDYTIIDTEEIQNKETKSLF